MNDLTPLLASSNDELERSLLGSVAEDEPSPDALSKAAVALGLGAAVITSLAGNAAGAAAGGVIAKHSAITLLSVVKWLAIGASAGIVASSSIHFAFRATPSAPPAHVVPAPRALAPEAPERAAANAGIAAPDAPFEASEARTPTAAIPLRGTPPLAEAETETETETETEALPPPPTAPTGPASAAFEPLAPSRAALPITPATSSLAEETQALDRVRRELEARRPTAALAELARFREQWPKGALRAEAAVLRVEALLGAGERAGAEREAEALIRVAPQSRHAARVRELLSR